MAELRPSRRTWVTLGAVSLLFFLVTAMTFSSLGVVLPAMVGEMGWSWSAAGLGFSLLGVFCGITSTIPAMLIRRFGIRANLALGGLVMAASFAALAATHDLTLYFIGCSLAGLGFTLLATVPGTYLLARGFERPAFAYGLYFTVGGLGGVAGPPLYLLLQPSSDGWRDFWIVSAVVTLIAALAAALLVDPGEDLQSGDPKISTDKWSVRAAVKTPQFVVIAAAYSVFLIVDITVNAASVAHLTHRGFSGAMAAGLLSLGALLNTLARLAGGTFARFIDPKRLLIFALLSLIIGLFALSEARDAALAIVYAAGVGVGSGLTFFASTILLLDYYGRRPNLELFAIVNLISTVGSVGPAFAGLAEDLSGSFVPAFLGLAGLVLAVLIGAVAMKPTQRFAK